MTREEKCNLAIAKGYIYNPETGDVIGPRKLPITKTTDGYLIMRFKDNLTGKYIDLKAHQFAWYYIHKEIVVQIDHINMIRNDNRLINLRASNNTLNQWNTISKGYTWNKSNNKYKVRITVNGEKLYFGCFDTEEEAKEIAKIAKAKYHII